MTLSPPRLKGRPSLRLLKHRLNQDDFSSDGEEVRISQGGSCRTQANPTLAESCRVSSTPTHRI